MSPHAPIFKSVFDEQWDQLPPVMHKHYANRPFTNDRVTVQGIMKIEMSSFAKLLSPLFHLTGALVPHTGENIPVTVHFKSELNSNAFCFDRIFHFPDKKPYHFLSKMVPNDKHEIIEYMPMGIGWKAGYRYDGSKVLMEHRGYVIRLFGKPIRLPIEFLLGRGNAEEQALTDNSFKMRMTIRHFLFGLIYAYSGEFKVTEINLDE